MQRITPRLVLREFGEDDLAALVDMESDPAMFQYEPGPLTREQTQERLRKAQLETLDEPRRHFRLAVTLAGQDELVGRISLHLNWAEIREWEIGWSIRRAFWGCGYATEAATAMLDFAFGELNAHRVLAICHAGNAASIRVMQKLGMRADGRLRETRWLHGQWHDELVYSVLEREWQSGSD